MRTSITSEQRPTMHLETITPKQAELILELQNTRNRRVSPRHVNQLVDAITRGEWRVNGASIKFGTGDPPPLLDGQHRLAALAKAGDPYTLTTFVVHGLPDDTQDTMDLTRRRGVAGQFEIAGVASGAEAIVATALTWFARYPDKMRERSHAVSPTRARELLAINPGLRDSVRYGRMLYQGVRVAPGLGTFLHYVIAQAAYPHEVRANEFFELVSKGVNLAEGEPMWVLRRWLENNRTDKRKAQPHVMAAIIIKGYNAHRLGKLPRFLAYRVDEPFPTPTSK